MAPDIESTGKRQHSISFVYPLLPFTHARSESINADSLNSNFLQLGRSSGGRPQRTVYPRLLPVNTVIGLHTTLVAVGYPYSNTWVSITGGTVFVALVKRLCCRLHQ